ncbi:MAG: sulfite exporter TauE/SafE family protein [Geodermatophilaceae bacterium]
MCAGRRAASDRIGGQAQGTSDRSWRRLALGCRRADRCVRRGTLGAAQGVVLIGLLGVFVNEELARLNAAKNVLAGLANLAAAIVFAAVTDVAWLVALVIAVGSTIGGQFGPRIGRRLPPAAYRSVIVIVGVTVSVVLLLD